MIDYLLNLAPFTPEIVVKFIVKFTVYASIAGLIVFVSRKKHYLSDIRIKGLLAFIVLACALSQTLQNHRITYPFVSWTMYSNPDPPPTYTEYLITSNDGEVLHYPFRYASFSSPSAFMKKLRDIIDECECHENDRIVDSFILGLERLYASKTGKSFDRMEINKIVFKLGDRHDLTRTQVYVWQKNAERTNFEME